MNRKDVIAMCRQKINDTKDVGFSILPNGVIEEIISTLERDEKMDRCDTWHDRLLKAVRKGGKR